MNIGINTKTDTSYLFSHLNNKNGNSNLNFLSDYASIKNGSYGKLMKAYYRESKSDAVKSLAQKSDTTAKNQETTQNLVALEKATDGLKSSADALLEKGSKSLFAEKEIVTKDKEGVETKTKGYDREAIYSAVNQFVKDYNAVIDASKKVTDTSVTGKVNNLMGATAANEKMLGQLGIRINEDGTLKMTKDAFDEADISKAKSLFQGSGSYGYRTSVQSSYIDYAASQAETKANTYTGNGTYGENFRIGNIFSSYF